MSLLISSFKMDQATQSLDSLLNALRAAGETTRLRLLAILSRNELTVSELTRILGQSQPRISRHLKLLCEAHLLDRYQEGSWVLYRVADTGPAAHIVQQLLQLFPGDDMELERDQQRLQRVKDEHTQTASVYFEKNAKGWDEMRKLYVAEEDVEKAMLAAVADVDIESLLDLGTGTGRILEVFSPHIQRGLGIDLSREMLAIARAKLESGDITHCKVRHGDIHDPPLEDASVDVITIHHVLHFLDDPAIVVDQAARKLKPGGRLLIVDFSPHQFEFLRDEHAHRRLGFSNEEVNSWLLRAGAESRATHHLTTTGQDKDQERLVVSLWVGQVGGI